MLRVRKVILIIFYEIWKLLKNWKKRLSKKINICIIVFGECVELKRGGGGVLCKVNFKLDEYLRIYFEKIMGCLMVFGF